MHWILWCFPFSINFIKLWCSPFPRSQTVLYIAQYDLKERYRNKTERIKRYCASTKTIGSTTHLQVWVNEQPNGTIRIKVEAYPLKSLAKAVQYLIEEFCEVIIFTKVIGQPNWLTHCMMHIRMPCMAFQCWLRSEEYHRIIVLYIYS